MVNDRAPVDNDAASALGETALHHGPAFADFVIDAGEAVGAPPDPALLSEIAARHGIDIVGPPPVP